MRSRPEKQLRIVLVTPYPYNVKTYARNVTDAQHVRVGDFVGPMATRLRA